MDRTSPKWRENGWRSWRKKRSKKMTHFVTKRQVYRIVAVERMEQQMCVAYFFWGCAIDFQTFFIIKNQSIIHTDLSKF